MSLTKSTDSVIKNVTLKSMPGKEWDGIVAIHRATCRAQLYECNAFSDEGHRSLSVWNYTLLELFTFHCWTEWAKKASRALLCFQNLFRTSTQNRLPKLHRRKCFPLKWSATAEKTFLRKWSAKWSRLKWSSGSEKCFPLKWLASKMIFWVTIEIFRGQND